MCCFVYSDVFVNVGLIQICQSDTVQTTQRVKPDKTQTTSQPTKAVPNKFALPQACSHAKGTQYFCVGSPQVFVSLSI